MFNYDHQLSLPFYFNHIMTGWWIHHPSKKYEFVIWDDEIPNIYGTSIVMFQTTNQIMLIWLNNHVLKHQPDEVLPTSTPCFAHHHPAAAMTTSRLEPGTLPRWAPIVFFRWRQYMGLETTYNILESRGNIFLMWGKPWNADIHGILWDVLGRFMGFNQRNWSNHILEP